MKYLLLFLLGLLFTNCTNKASIPKPNAFLKLAYPKANYNAKGISKSYAFKHSHLAEFKTDKNQWATLYYPTIKAEINITYQPINNNLTQLVRDAEKLTYKHTVKADNIEVYPFENQKNNVYARLFALTGNVASPIQFQITDSIQHFLYGSLYFDAKPNYDSIIPAIDYINKDIKHMIETLTWQE